MIEITPEAFEEQINSRMAGASVPNDEIIMHTDQNSVNVREVGAYVTMCILGDTAVLYSPLVDTLTKPDMIASHAMFPVGAHDGLGGQDGVPRWIDYKSDTPGMSFTTHMISLMGVTPPGHPQISRHFAITRGGLVISTVVSNLHGTEDLHTSIGERLYFVDRESDPENLKISDIPIERFFGEDEADRILRGQPQFWQGHFKDGVDITLSTGQRVNMLSNIAMSPSMRFDSSKIAGMQVRHLEGTESMCIEPSFGVTFATPESEDLRNDRLLLPVGSVVAMTTRLTIEAEEWEELA